MPSQLAVVVVVQHQAAAQVELLGVGLLQHLLVWSVQVAQVE
jgi:hypothetical protein